VKEFVDDAHGMWAVVRALCAMMREGRMK